MTPHEQHELAVAGQQLGRLIEQVHAGALAPEQATHLVVERVVQTAFAPACGPFSDEVDRLNRRYRLHGKKTLNPGIRAKFIGGHPGGLRPRGYVLSVTLNHKSSVAAATPEIDDLNDPTRHLSACHRLLHEAVLVFQTGRSRSTRLLRASSCRPEVLRKGPQHPCPHRTGRHRRVVLASPASDGTGVPAP